MLSFAAAEYPLQSSSFVLPLDIPKPLLLALLNVVKQASFT